MQYIQEVTVDGNDLVVTIRNAVSQSLVGTKRWEGAARYVFATKQFSDRKSPTYVMAVPMKAGLDLADLESV